MEENGSIEYEMSWCFEPQHNFYADIFAPVVRGFLTLICVILGTICNIQGISSVHKLHIDKNRGAVLAVSMMSLAFWDTLLLVSALLYYCVGALFPRNEWIRVITPFTHGFAHVANTASIWCVVVITIQRFMATRDPFQTNRRIPITHSFRTEKRRISFFFCKSNGRLFGKSLIVSLLAIICNLPTFAEMKTKPCFSISQNRTMIGAVASPLRHNFVYLIVRTVLRILFVSIGPNVFIFVVTILTVNILRVSNKSRRKLFRMNQSLIEQYASRENNQTLLALMIAVKFLVLRGLVFAIDLFEVIIGFNDPNFPLLNQFMSYAVDISNLFVIINSATNCMMYLKGAQWLDSKFNDRQTIKRKKTICEEGQLLGDRLTILCTSWDKVMKNTGGELGTRIAWNMLRKHPTMLNLKNDEPEKVSLLNGSCKRSIDHVKLKEIGNRITAFIYELLDLMKNSQTEDVITCRIRRVGAVHYDRKINFKTSLFKEFKNTILCAVADCEYDTPEERDLAIESWNIFTSFIIKEMKMGTWVMNDNVHQVP